jgi:hypothetical protein
MIFLANYVQSDDFCFFSSRKRRINKLPFSLFLSFLKPHYACVHQGKEEYSLFSLLSFSLDRYFPEILPPNYLTSTAMTGQIVCPSTGFRLRQGYTGQAGRTGR